jgi:hypothetical protein
MDLTSISRLLHLIATEYTFSSAAYGSFSEINHIFQHKVCLNKYQKIDIISGVLSDYNGIKLEISNKKL